MTVRTDLTVHWARSPRLIYVAAPSTEITVQDLVDTLRHQEDLLENMDNDHLIEAAGKEALGGGVLVGITATLQNAQVAFDARTIARTFGTVTTLGTTRLIDSAADFVADGVEPGDTAVNMTDQSAATVIAVISLTELLLEPLQDGDDDTWQVSDAYKIYETAQCEISGGNLVAVDSLGAALSPVFPTAYTQIILARASTATLSELDAIQYASYGGGVSVDVVNGITGTEYPSGNKEYPVDNIPDAVAIASSKGFDVLYILGDITLDTGDSVVGLTLEGQNSVKTTITINTGAETLGCEFSDATIQGILDGNSWIKACSIGDLSYVEGHIHGSLLTGTITLGGTEAQILDCWSGVPGGGTPTIDMGGSGASLSMRNYNGGIELINKSGSESVSIDMNSGQIVLDATVTNGLIVCRGIGKLTDNSVGATVDAANLLQGDAITADLVWDEILTGSEHNTPTSAGRRLREISSAVITGGTAQGPGLGNNQIQLNGNASTIDGTYDPAMVYIIGGTGAGQTRLILEYEGSTRRATVDRSWKVSPDDTSEYIIAAHPGREHVNEGLAQGGTIDTITLNVLASSFDDAYKYQTIFLRGGTGEDQVRVITAYNGTNKEATVGGDWDVIPDTTSSYVMLPQHIHEPPDIADAVWDELIDDHAVAGSAGEVLAFIRDVEGGRWLIDEATNEMIFYEADNVTEVARFALKDVDGVAASEDVYERVRTS